MFVLNEWKKGKKKKKKPMGQFTTFTYLRCDRPASQGGNLINFRNLQLMCEISESRKLAKKILEVKALFSKEKPAGG